MEDRTLTIESKIDKNLTLKVIPGHFITAYSHVNNYIDVTRIKIHAKEAKIAAKFFSDIYATSVEIDTIVCMDGTQVIGGYLAEMLSASGIGNYNEGKDIHVVTPETNNVGQLFFRDNIQSTIENQKILILVGNGSTGTTLDKSINCINYYKGWVNGLGAIFSAVEMVKDLRVDHIFSTSDIPGGYEIYENTNCPLCNSGLPIDAIVNSYGYSKF